MAPCWWIAFGYLDAKYDDIFIGFGNYTSIFKSHLFNHKSIYILMPSFALILQRKIAQIKVQRMHPYLLLSTTFNLCFMTENGLVPRSGTRLTKAYDVTIQRYRNSRAKLENSKMYILRCMGSKFCVKFQRCPLKFHTKFWTHTPQNIHFTMC